MKKKLLFFLLTVVCTLLCAPPNAHAWDFSKVGDPLKIGVLPSSANVPSGEFFLEFDSTTKTWSKEFTPTATTSGQIWFCIKCYYDGGSVQYCFNNGNSTIGSWYYINVDWSFDSNYFWQKGITANKSYRFELQPCGSSADATGNANFKWRIVEATVATPTFSPAAGDVDPNTEITINCATSGATIYYTIDGSDPSSSSTRKTYSASNKPKITSGCTVKAIAVKSGMNNSTVASASYAINYQWDFSGNTLPKDIRVNFDAHWNSNVDLTYADGIWSAEFTPTSVSTDGEGGYVNFWIQPSPDGTNFPIKYGANDGQPSTNGKWTTNTLTKTSHFYQGGLVANTRYLFELTAVDGNTKHFQWRITKVTNKVATPTFSPAAGKVNQGTAVTISCSTPDATIYYTTDGNTPTTASTEYTGAITIDAAKTIKAFAVKGGMTNSDMATAAYTVEIPYDFSSNTKPSKIIVHPSQSITNPAFSKFDLTFENGIWSGTFTPTNAASHDHNVNFSIQVDDDYFYWANKGTNTLGEWVKKAKGQVGDGHDYFQGNIEDNQKYIFELRASEDEKSNFDWRIYKYVDPSKQYTVSVDLSQMGTGKWNASDVHACFKKGGATDGSDNLNGWPGDESSYTKTVNGDIVTFTYASDTKPVYVVFNNGNGGNGNQTSDLTYIANHTYILKSQDSNGFWQTDAGQPVADYNLPYGPKDFTDAKYFLVGSRMGMWRLQPEWELIKQADGSYKIDGGRYMFHGHFAVAKVENFAKYSKHEYTILYTKTNTSITRANKSISNLTLTADKIEKNPVYYNAADGTGASNKALSFRYIGTGDDFNNAGNDKGTWCKEITFKDGTITFDIDDSDPNMASERVFTLVGQNIYHNEYASDSDQSGRETPRGQTGWQESWIQYGPNGRPYFDANNEYLYHTAYVPSILNSTSVNFQIDVNGKDFDYSSKAVTFVERDNLTNLSTDKYRELYDYFIQHPEAVTSGATVQGGNEADGTAFNFTLGTLPEFDSENAAWQVYVVRDAWVKGLFKIWNGWGGNSINNEGMGGTATGARWNALNGGPENTEGDTTKESQPTDVVLTDVNAGAEAQGMNKVYMNQGSGSNWKTENGELQYYNRIILLYNTAATDRLANSFVLFIQDDTAPVIKAFLEGDNNKGYVEWNLQNVKAGSEAVITGYTITRYRVTDEGNINPAVVTTVSGIETPVSEFEAVRTEHDPDELNPGQYQYHIEVTYVNGTETGTREANSNRIRVLGVDIYPEVRVEQLVSLTKEGFTEDVFNALGKTTSYNPGHCYLTYRDDNPTADYYVLTTSESDNITNVEQVAQIDTDIARAILKDPNNYVWCARFYVRALDYTQYKHYYERQGLTCSEPQITITDEAAVDAIDNQNWTAQNGYTGKNIPTQQYQVKLTSGAVNTYMGAFIDRSGLLYAGKMKADMSYTFNTGSEEKPVLHDHTVNFTPVVANPHSLSYKYEYRSEEFGNPVREYLESAIQNEGSNLSLSDDFKARIKFKTTTSAKISNPKEIYVYADESLIVDERHLDCTIQFYRPNLSNNILKNYNIYYTVKLTTEEAEDVTDADRLLADFMGVTLEGEYYDDEDKSDINSSTGIGTKRPYQVKITDTHPSGKIYPRFEIVKVEYKRIHGTTVTEHTLATNHSYGPLVITAPNNPNRYTTVDEIGLGWNEGRNPDGTVSDKLNRWLLYGHKELEHTATPDKYTAMPSSRFFLLEINDGENHDYSETLWKHVHDNAHQDPTGFWIENTPFLIGSLPKNGDKKPDVTATPVYLFHRNPGNIGVQGDAVINLHKVEKDTPASVKRRADDSQLAPANKDLDPTKVTYTQDGNVITDAEYDASGSKYFMLLKSDPAYAEGSKSPVMTGIEDIVDDANTEAVYYNLQGIQVAKPEHGKVYIRVSGRTAEKVIY